MIFSKPVFFLLLLVLSACGNKIIYYGRSYQPTQNVDLYFREGDISEPNEIMGKLTYEVTAKKASDKVQAKLTEYVKKKGADAIIFDDVSLTNTGSTSGGAGAGAGRKRIFFGLFTTKTKYSKGQQVKATIIKYKKNI
ncbi:MAG: hypothetical protein JNJ75_13810 [Cyclobacteriaceae bacterium]|nr:hypothetical protein [Cyclobacteriaceae bacterium]